MKYRVFCSSHASYTKAAMLAISMSVLSSACLSHSEEEAAPKAPSVGDESTLIFREKPGVTDAILRVPTTPATVWNSLKGWEIREKVTIQMPDKEGNLRDCTLPVTYHPDIGSEAPTLLLHGLTDSGEAYQPYLKYLKAPRNKHFIVMDWPRNGKADCDVVTDIKGASQAVIKAYKKFRETYNRKHTHPYEQLKFPRTIGGHSMGALVGSLMTLDPDFSDANLALYAPAYLKKKPSMQALGDFVASASDIYDANEFLRRAITPGAHPMLDLAQEAPVLGSLVIKPLTGEAHLNRLKWVRPYVDTLMENDGKAYDEAVAALMARDPSKVLIFVGKRDLLTPPAEMEPSIRERFKKRIRYLDCGHNINRDCFKVLPKDLW